MDSRVAVAVAVLVVTAGIAVVGPAAGAATANETVTPTPTENSTNESDAQFGATVSSFMQASAADAEGSVDNGMWAAEYARANASERPELVRDRTAQLERRLARLEAERAALLNDSDGVTVQDRAKAARLAARIDALEDSINTTADAAAETGVNRTRLEELRTRAHNLSGQEVARMARNLTFGPPGDTGPSESPGGGQAGDAGNATDREAVNETSRGNRTDDQGQTSEDGTDDGSGTSGESSPDRPGSDGQNGSASDE